MSYIVTTRNSRTRKLLVMLDDDDVACEFDSRDEAEKYADEVPVCRAWGFEIVEVLS